MGTRVITFLVAAALLGFLAGTGFGDDPDPEQAKEMKEMAAMGRPGKPHALLARMAGHWEVEARTWTGPGHSSTTRGTSVNRMVMGGRFLQTTYKGSFLGKPFEGTGYLGFDNLKRRFQSAWIASTGTAIEIQEGDTDSDGTKIELRGSYDTRESSMPNRVVYSVQDDDHFTMESYVVYQGQEVRDMELKFHRVKVAPAMPVAPAEHAAPRRARRRPCCPPPSRGPGY
jgi:hypothetical protein